MTAADEVTLAGVVVCRDQGYVFPMAGAHRCCQLDGVRSLENLYQLLLGNWVEEMEDLRHKAVPHPGPPGAPARTLCESFRVRMTELQEQFIRLRRPTAKRITVTCLHYAVSDALLSSLFDGDRAPSAHPQNVGGTVVVPGVKRSIK